MSLIDNRFEMAYQSIATEAIVTEMHLPVTCPQQVKISLQQEYNATLSSNLLRESTPDGRPQFGKFISINQSERVTQLFLLTSNVRQTLDPFIGLDADVIT